MSFHPKFCQDGSIVDFSYDFISHRQLPQLLICCLEGISNLDIKITCYILGHTEFLNPQQRGYWLLLWSTTKRQQLNNFLSSSLLNISFLVTF